MEGTTWQSSKPDLVGVMQTHQAARIAGLRVAVAQADDGLDEGRRL